MANQEQLEILKQGVEAWNKWRKKNPKIEVDLSGANLSEFDLSEANLSAANLSDVNLVDADLVSTNLNNADLTGADLIFANFKKANLSYAILRFANFGRGYLGYANLSNANLNNANFNKVVFDNTNLSEAVLGDTTFAQVDLSKISGLEAIQHKYPSTIGTDTIQLSKGKIPEVFLRGCGLSDLDIEYAKLYKPDLSNSEIDEILYRIHDIRANQSIQISPLFISYSHADTEFVERLEPRLTEKGIRFWRDTHDMKAGRMERQVDHAMRQNPTVILILSQNSIRSDWVEHEARLARELEKEFGRDVLCPVALDTSWKSAKWPARLMEQIKEYNILDYSKWKDDKAFGQVFNKMLSGLDMFYKPESPK